jgi:hypothetical protein
VEAELKVQVEVEVEVLVLLLVVQVPRLLQKVVMQKTLMQKALMQKVLMQKALMQNALEASRAARLVRLCEEEEESSSTGLFVLDFIFAVIKLENRRFDIKLNVGGDARVAKGEAAAVVVWSLYRQLVSANGLKCYLYVLE